MFEMLVIIFGVYAFTFGRVRLPWELCISGEEFFLEAINVET